MQLKTLLIVLCLSTMFFSCNSNTSKKAFNYSENIVSKEKALSSDIKTTEADVEKYFEENKYDSVISSADRMASIIQKSIDEIKSEPIPDGVKEGGEFKQSAIAYFEKLKSVYTAYSSLAAAHGDDTSFENERLKLIDIVKNKDKGAEDIYAAQMKFAKANNFNLEEKK